MNKIAGYKKGDEIQVRTHVAFAGTPQNGEAFETWEDGTVIAEGLTSVNEYGEDWQQRIIIKTEDGTHIRSGMQLR